MLKSHWDPFAKIWDICHGETRINGKPVTSGMSFTKARCDATLAERVQRDYYEPLTECIADFDKKPVNLQASMTSGAYNFGVGAMFNSTAAKLARTKKYREACERRPHSTKRWPRAQWLGEAPLDG
ncbi:glycoside hydrolase family protein [Rhizobium sp. Root1220]|uniref:glycoside hydrolase family protein n=1 Tax=Rhizobium sp. Root1220 TaxID=1736432 RepID=UPI000B25C0BE|nr:glycoside hydrolase family protein [Rhizobium sp. Root1220]